MGITRGAGDRWQSTERDLPPIARFATVRWIRFPRVMTPSLASADESWHALLLPVTTSEASAITSSAASPGSSSNMARRIPAARCS
jgi:hypothetical protein